MEMVRLQDFVPSAHCEIGRRPQWYVLQTEPLREHALNGYLVGRRFRTYAPSVPYWTTRGVRRTKVRVLKPMFRGLLFIHLDLAADEDRLHFIRIGPGFNSFLRYRASHDYAVIGDADLRQVEIEEEKACNPEVYASRFAVGEHVRVADGHFSGFNVEICELGDEERITVLIGMLGREVRWQTSPLNLEKL